MLDVKNLTVFRGQTQVLRDVSLSVGKGETVALIGANGAGKTTTLAAISGMLPIRSGEIQLTDQAGKSHALHAMSSEKIVRLGMSHCPEGRQVFAGLSVRENLMIGAFLRTDSEGIRSDLDRILTLFPFMAKRLNDRGGALSGGQQMMLAIGRALMSRPSLLLLDEPSLGLAPKTAEQIFEVIIRINAEGCSVLLVEQNAFIALELADRAYVLETGRIALAGSGQELSADPRVRDIYLGGSTHP